MLCIWFLGGTPSCMAGHSIRPQGTLYCVTAPIWASPSDSALRGLGEGGLTENSMVQQKTEPRIREATSRPMTHSKLPALLGWPFFSTPTSPRTLPESIWADCQMQAAPAFNPQFLHL